ncbi:unnamed protein product [Urochloa humidicola]
MESSNLAAAANLGVLPQEVLFDVLVRLPAKDIGRLRIVCRPWRNLTSDPLFIKEHAARHPDQFIVASFHADSEHIHVMDLFGRVVKSLPISITKRNYFLRSCPDLIGVGNVDGSCCLIDPVTGAISHLPKTDLKGLSSSILQEYDDSEYYSSNSDGWEIYSNHEQLERCVFLAGRVHSTGEYKVLRLVCDAYMRIENLDDEHHPVSSVLTINSGDRADWRATRSHPEFLLNMDYMDGGVVVGSTIHFFWSQLYPDGTQLELLCNGVDVDCIASFDLEAEEWTSIPGPRPVNNSDIYSMSYDSILAELNGYLVVVHYHYTTIQHYRRTSVGKGS